MKNWKTHLKNLQLAGMRGSRRRRCPHPSTCCARFSSHQIFPSENLSDRISSDIPISKTFGQKIVSSPLISTISLFRGLHVSLPPISTTAAPSGLRRSQTTGAALNEKNLSGFISTSYMYYYLQPLVFIFAVFIHSYQHFLLANIDQYLL